MALPAKCGLTFIRTPDQTARIENGARKGCALLRIGMDVHLCLHRPARASRAADKGRVHSAGTAWPTARRAKCRLFRKRTSAIMETCAAIASEVSDQ